MIASTAAPALSGKDASSIADGAVPVVTIMFWSFALNWLAYRVPVIDRLIHPPPLPLVRDGRLMRRNLRRELITEEELKTQFRQEGVNDYSQVRVAYLEGDGTISVIAYETQGRPHTGS